MDIKKITKAELLSIIENRDYTIESLRHEISSERKRKEDAYKVSRDHAEDKRILQIQVSQLLHGNIADIKSLQNMLSIFHNDSMTHNEKSYLSKKISQFCDGLIDTRLEAVHDFYRHKDGMPF